MPGGSCGLNFLFLDTVGYESALRLSSHHFERILAGRGHRVVALAAPVTPLHRLARSGRRAIARRFEFHRRGLAEAPQGLQSGAAKGVLNWVPKTWLPVKNVYPLNTPRALELAASGYMDDVRRRLAGIDFVPDVVSIENLAYGELARSFTDAVLHYRMVDCVEGFTDMPRCMIEAEPGLLNDADLVSITSRQFAGKLAGRNESKVIYAPNAVDIEHFARSEGGPTFGSSSASSDRPAEYAGFERPIAIYVGALRGWFDWEMLLEAVRRLPEVEFVLISPDRPREDYSAFRNARWIPGVDYERLPAYLRHASVGLVPFLDSPLVAPVNPMKMYEYLAAGLPVVCGDWAELRRIGAPVRRARTAAEFATGIKQAIREGPLRDRRDFLASHSWEAEVDDLLGRIGELR